MPPSRIRYLEEKEIQKKADDFLDHYHPSLELPVPIEDIIELSLGIKIFPLKGLSRDFGVESYITSNFKQIVIEDNCYFNNTNRCRFTFAHEVAHFVLHRDFYQTSGITDIRSYILFQDTITNVEIKRIELQAYYFAGYVLLPNDIFRKAFLTSLKIIGGKGSLTITGFLALCHDLAVKFDVSDEVIGKQIKIDFPDIHDAVLNLA